MDKLQSSISNKLATVQREENERNELVSSCTLEDLPGAVWLHFLPFLSVSTASMLYGLSRGIRMRFIEQQVLQNAAIPLTATTESNTLAFVLVNRMKNVYWKEMAQISVSDSMFTLIKSSPFLRGIVHMLSISINNTEINLNNFTRVKILHVECPRYSPFDLTCLPANLLELKITAGSIRTIEKLFLYPNLKSLFLNIRNNANYNVPDGSLHANICHWKSIVWRFLRQQYTPINQTVQQLFFPSLLQFVQQNSIYKLQWKHFEYGQPTESNVQQCTVLDSSVLAILNLCTKLKIFVLHCFRVDFHDLMLALPESVEVVVFNGCYLTITEVIKTLPSVVKVLTNLRAIRFNYSNELVFSDGHQPRDKEKARKIFYQSTPQVTIPRLDYKTATIDLCPKHFAKRDDIDFIQSSEDCEIDALLCRYYFIPIV